MYLPRRPLSARWWPGQGHAVNDALTLRSTVTNSNRATPFGGHPVARWSLGMIAICQAAGCPGSGPGRWFLGLLADTCGTRTAGICRGRDVGRGSAFASPTTYDVTTSAQELDDRYRPCQGVACPLSSGAQPGSHPSGPRHRSCGSAACSRAVGRGNALLRQRGALPTPTSGPICGNP